MITAQRPLVAIIIAALVGALASSFINNMTPSNDELIRDFYRIEAAVSVSPHGIRKKMAKGDKSFILVDLRSSEEYEREHIVGAISIPAYSDPEHSAYDQVDRIVGAFNELPEDKTIIVYCYSIPCMTGRKMGHMLAEHGIYVQLLGVGWNEWRHFWTMWNHEHEWSQTNVFDYVISGTEPGEPKIDPNYISPCLEGEFDC
jgi:rhodanese-related sulfurtransferase|tara:strand:+ start:1065 stop:1667 length:603 start_codon:yes stop_codon:yes gene_type:complete